jgi:hypothetical protein
MSLVAAPSFIGRPAVTLPRYTRYALSWVVVTLVLAAVGSSLAFVGLLLVANAIHIDVNPELASLLSLLEGHPRLVFAGDSRTRQQVDPLLVARLLDEAPGYAVDISAPSADPVEFLAIVKAHGVQFRNIDLVLSLSPYQINDGARRPFLASAPMMARLSLWQQLRMFVPTWSDTLVWFIKSTFAGRARDQRPGRLGEPLASRLGFEPVQGAVGVGAGAGNSASRAKNPVHGAMRPYDRHPFYQDWQPFGMRAAMVRDALCSMRPLVHRLIVVAPPWAPIPDRATPRWEDWNRQFLRLLAAMASQCGAEFLSLAVVPGLSPDFFADEVHVNAAGSAIYSAYLLHQLGYVGRLPQ